MTPWMRRALVRGLIGPVAYGVISLLVGLFYFIVVGNILDGFYPSAGNKIYKNYVEKYFVNEITVNEEVARQISGLDQVSREGTFVVIPINDVIVGRNAQRIWDQLYIAARLTLNVKAIIFLVDSPGGGVTESDYLYEEIRKIKKTTGIKVVTFVNSLSASGAYYITAQSDKIISSPTALVGSIGVLWKSVNVGELIRKVGVSVDVIKSSDMKDIGSPYRKMSDGETAVFRRIIDHNYDRFKAIVKEGRGLSDSQVHLTATGEVWHAQDAKMLGLVDEIGYVSRAIDVAMELTGVNMPTVVKYEEEMNFRDIFGVRSPTLGFIKNIDGAVDRFGIPIPKLFYVWTP